MKVKLEDILEVFELQTEDSTHYYNKKTGVIMYVDNQEREYGASDIDHLEDFEEWQQEIIRGFYDIENNPDDYIKLPTSEDINEEKLRKEFLLVIEDDDNRGKVEESLSGKDRDKSFRDTLSNLGLLNDWFDYREEVEKLIAIDWCKRNGINIE